MSIAKLSDEALSSQVLIIKRRLEKDTEILREVENELCRRHSGYVRVTATLSHKRTREVVETIKFTPVEAEPLLELTNVPEPLKTRSHLRKFLFIRECYEPILDDIARVLPVIIVKTVAILGTAGIGKSAFLLYCLHRLRQDPAIFGVTTRSFYFQDEPGLVYLYEHQQDADNYEVITITNKRSLDPTILMLADLMTATVPMEHGGPCLIFTSFNPARYKEMVKSGGCCRIMPTWPAEEQSRLFGSVQFQSDYSADIAQRAYDNMQYFGGAIRHNIVAATLSMNPTIKLDQEIQIRGADVCERYFGAGFGGSETETPDLLVHRNPSGFGGYDVDGMVYSFASPYVLRSLARLNTSIFATKARNKFTAGTYSGGDDGNIFELLCLHTFKISGVQFTARPLSPQAPACTVVFPPKEILPKNWRGKQLRANTLYIPAFGNLESGDAFCVLMLNGVSTLIVVQCTIAETHPVKNNGIRVIAECFSALEQTVQRKLLMFMIPRGGNLNVPQTIVTKQGSAVQRAAAVEVDDQYAIENSLEFL